MKYFIITGTSSGLGEAIAIQAIKAKHNVFCISRKLNEKLVELATAFNTGVWYYEADLIKEKEIPEIMADIFNNMDTDSISELTLINNAGIIEPIGPMGKIDNLEILQHVNINLLAPLLLINEFISRSESFHIKKNIINISSGAATNPYFGWCLYCSAKAGLDMITKTVGLEQAQQENPVMILSIAPGVIDTPMQRKLRETDINDFPMKPRFDKLYEDNLLKSPIDAANQILGIIENATYSTGEKIDLR